MNKKLSLIFKILCVTFCFAICACILGGCSKDIDIMDYMSDIRETLYAGEDDKIYVTVVSGERETPYKYDGIKNSNVPFCIVSVFPTGAKVDDSTLDVELIVGDTSHAIVLEKSPYENAFLEDFGSKVAAGQNVRLVCEDLGVSIDLVNESQKWEITSEDAIKIAAEELSDKINSNVENGMLNGECYLKIIYDKSREMKNYYWYFSFVPANGKTSSCVIDPTTGKVLAKI